MHSIRIWILRTTIQIAMLTAPTAWAAAQCPDATKYLGHAPKVAGLDLIQQFGGRMDVNGPLCSTGQSNYLWRGGDSIAACKVGGRSLRSFSLTNHDERPTFAAAYIFAGKDMSVADVSALLGGISIAATEHLPDLLEPILGRSAFRYTAGGGRYFIGVRPRDDDQVTVLVADMPAMEPERENILACWREAGLLR